MKQQPSTSRKSSKEWAHDKMGAHRFRHQRFLRWWFDFAAPPEARAGATDGQLDTVQRGRTASLILLGLIPIMVGVGCIGLIGPNKQIFWTALGIEIIVALCIAMNRSGGIKSGSYWGVNATGILLAISITFGMYLSLLRAPGGLSPDDKDIFYMLMFSEVIIGATLPARWIFVALIGNLAFTYYMLLAGRHTPSLNALLATSLPIIALRVFQDHVIPDLAMWAKSLTTTESMERANHAEKVAMLEHDLALKEQQEAQKAAVERQQVEMVSSTLMRVSRGDLSARVPSEAGSTLWQLAAPLNRILEQLERSQQAERRLQAVEPLVETARMQQHQWGRLTKEAQTTCEIVQAAIEQGKPIRLTPGQTPLDDLQRALNGKVLTQAPHSAIFLSENRS